MSTPRNVAILSYMNAPDQQSPKTSVFIVQGVMWQWCSSQDCTGLHMIISLMLEENVNICKLFSLRFIG